MSEWLEKIKYYVEKIKTTITNFDELVVEMEKLEYKISYPEAFKKKYWDK